MFNLGFNNGYNNSQQMASLNTNIYKSFSDTCLFTAMAWNEQLSVKFAPLKAVDANGKRTYASEKNEIASTSLTKENSIALSEGIKEFLLPAISSGKGASVSVNIGTAENKKVLTVSTDGKEVYITLYLGVNDAGVSTGDNVTHQFNKREFMTEYDPKSGKCDVLKIVHSDFLNFYNIVDSVKNLNQMIPHSFAYGKMLKGGNTNNPNGNNYQQRQSYNNNQQNASNNSAPMNTYNSIDDFLPM